LKNKFAAFTIVKNESYFLPIWLKYYSRFFQNKDIYVLDHESTDGSTDSLGVNAVPVHNEFAFDHQWLVETVQNFQKELLDRYECVVFAEADELLYCPSSSLGDLLNRFLSNQSMECLTSVGYEVIQNLGEEGSLGAGDEVFGNRKYFFRYPLYDKTLISKVPLNWEWGFHRCDKPQNFAYGSHIMHLHRVDFELMLKRHEERAKRWKLKNDGAAGVQHRIGDREGVLNYFNKTASPIEKVPNDHLRCFEGL